jgi:hypothetical protein
MGREVRRVPKDFNWLMGKIWEGYIRPPDGLRQCGSCEGSGYNTLGQAISTMLRSDSKLQASDQIVFQALASAMGRPPQKDAYQGLFFSGIDQGAVAFDLMLHLGKSLHLPTHAFHCDECRARGSVVYDLDLHAISNMWVPVEPPTGTGWQLWETDRYPITPVCKSAKGLIKILVTAGTYGTRPGEPMTQKEAETLVRVGWDSAHPQPTRQIVRSTVTGYRLAKKDADAEREWIQAMVDIEDQAGGFQSAGRVRKRKGQP